MTFHIDLYLQGHSTMTAIKLQKYGASCRVRSTAHTVLDGFLPYLAQIVTSISGCVACNDIWSWPIYSRQFSHDFAKSCSNKVYPIVSASHHVQFWMDNFHICNDLCSSLLSSSSFGCDVAYFMDYIHMWHRYNPRGDDQSRTYLSRSIGQISRRQCHTGLSNVCDRAGGGLLVVHRSTVSI